MRFKYARNLIPDLVGPGRRSNPNKWIMGSDPMKREKYYAWLKHRSQAAFRKEDYSLTWEDWELLWSDDDFSRRGRGMDNMCMFLIDRDQGWHLNNVAVEQRGTSFMFNGNRKSDA